MNPSKVNRALFEPHKWTSWVEWDKTRLKMPCRKCSETTETRQRKTGQDHTDPDGSRSHLWPSGTCLAIGMLFALQPAKHLSFGLGHMPQICAFLSHPVVIWIVILKTSGKISTTSVSWDKVVVGIVRQRSSDSLRVALANANSVICFISLYGLDLILTEVKQWMQSLSWQSALSPSEEMGLIAFYVCCQELIVFKLMPELRLSSAWLTTIAMAGSINHEEPT